MGVNVVCQKSKKLKIRFGKFDISKKKRKMWQTIGTACILTFLVVIPISNGLYFHIAETERKCFIEEIPDETMVTGNYKVQLYDPRTNGFAPSSPNIGMHVEVRDPEDKIILSKVYSSEGKWTFTSHTPGEHVICLYTNSTKWFSGTQLRVHLDINVGEHAINYADVAQKEKLSELQLRVRQLLDQVEQITKGIARKDSVKQVKARIPESFGGRLDKLVFSW